MHASFEKRDIFRNLKNRYIQHLNEAADCNSARLVVLDYPTCPLSKGERWGVMIKPVSFTERDIGASGTDPRSYLVEYDPVLAEDFFKAKFSGLKTGRRFFVIYLNTDLCPGCQGNRAKEEWIIQLERVLLAIAHELHYIGVHYTLHQILDTEEYCKTEKSRFKNPVTRYDYNLLCSMTTLMVCLDSVEGHVEAASHAPLFSNETEFLEWRKVDEVQRTKFNHIQSFLHEKHISWYRAEREMASTMEKLGSFFRGIPRHDGTRRIDVELVGELEQVLDQQSHAHGS